jgi:hypothetical protein
MLVGLTDREGRRTLVVSDDRRRGVERRLTEVLGEEAAEFLMDHMPPLDWSSLATKQDLEAFATKRDLEAFATKRDLEAFATKKDLETHAAATKKDLEILEFRLRAEMADGFAKLSRTFVVSQIALAIATIGSLTGAVATLAH